MTNRAIPRIPPVPGDSNPMTLLIIKMFGLAVFGIAFQRAVTAAEGWIPREIYHGTSFTLGLLTHYPLTLPLAFGFLALAAWSFSPTGSRELSWKRFDSHSGVRWVVFGPTLALTWAYAGYPHNFYFDQPHLFDRAWLIVIAALVFRSPIFALGFAVQVLISRAQTYHVINAITPIVDELPLRVLGIAFGFGVWNLLLRTVRRRFPGIAERVRIEPSLLVYSVLLLLGSYYFYGGLAKLEIGENPLDWMMESHLENFLIASYLYGWLAFLSEARILEIASFVGTISPLISLATLIIEIGMLFLLVERRLTLGLLSAAIAMHTGIALTTGVWFWQWMVVDLSVLCWLWLRRGDDTLRQLYARPVALFSLALIIALSALFSNNHFAWWNTKWTTALHLEGLDRDGKSYSIDYSDFYPYLLVGYMKPYRSIESGIYGINSRQDLMRRLETVKPAVLIADLRSRRGENFGDHLIARKRSFDDFAQHFLGHRNRRLARGSSASPLAFIPSPPRLRIRDPKGPNPYRDQAQIVGLRVRYSETYYTGSALLHFHDEVIHFVEIPHDE